MLIRMVETGMHIDDIVFIEVMATPTLGAELPEMYEYMERMDGTSDEKSPLSVQNWILKRHSINPIVPGRAGTIYGFPLTVGAWCTDRLKLRTIRRHYKTYGEHIRYLGLAADEPKRIARLEPVCRAPLAEWGMGRA